MFSTHTRGVSLVDAVVGTALVLVIFLGLFAVLRASVTVSALAKAKSGGTAILNERMEYIRSLSYDKVGTEGGIPPGVIPEEEERHLNDTLYTLRTFVQYVDDPADGLAGEDENGIITDYKKVTVTATYTVGGRERTLSFFGTISPKGIETSTGGGTLLISVIDALGAPVSAASVRIQNASTTPVTDVTAFTNTAGRVFLPGAATSTGYRVSVSKTGYSSAGTYTKDEVNANPNPGHLTVVTEETTSGTFAIDLLSSLLVQTFSPVQNATSTESFADTSGIETSEHVDVSSGALALVQQEGVYAPSGYAQLQAVLPEYLDTWEEVVLTQTLPEGTSVRASLFDADGVIVPEEILPGNTAGFTTSRIALNTLSTEVYPALTLRLTLETANDNVSPTVDEVSFTYQSGPTPLPDVPFTLRGTKEIGTTGDGSPIYKNTITTNTAGNGEHELINIEWDGYVLSIPDYDVISSCPLSPVPVPPLTSMTLSLILGPVTSHALRVAVLSSTGLPVSDALVTLERASFSAEGTSDACGQVYFGGLSAHDDYIVTVEKAGHIPSVDTITVSGQTLFRATLE